ncbi:hypothetical protein EJ05DRAFT_211555 [Pseudovirgaria hyperparasitica]|uniref:Amidohydrolase-related domain-containing protein n=1 Tax=Pseudovirgaria hyperparasitica TaxID=470096 RepID=A0A6A6VSY7_9PEZI|nr:uncharacterized protein EJ05DRAFT_211555 [Pseudovirgaria hyperparasitica]KAF2753333.1 hypothetical protein EJ05DRAFT_211555 [Pseudovirgaria hyperparasitica]
MSSFIIKDARVFTGRTVYETGYVHVADGKIVAVGENEPTDTSPDLHVISRPGHTLLPGLIDCHVHADKGNENALYQSIRFGVTTVCDMHNEPWNIEKLRKLAGSSKEVSDLKAAGLAATVDGGWPMPVVTAHDKSQETLDEIKTWPKLKNEEDVETYLDSNVGNGADFIKLMNESGSFMGKVFPRPSPALQAALVRGAHARGLKTTAHALSRDDTLGILRAGTDGLAHTFVDKPINDEIVDAFKTNNAWLNPTLSTIGSMCSEGKAMQHQYAHDPRIQNLCATAEREKTCKCLSMATESCKWEYAFGAVKKLKAEGIDIVCGSDSAGPALGTAYGLTMHQELALFVQKCTFSPEEALRAATATIADRFGFNDRGVLETGRRADLMLVEGNPLEDIDNTLNLRGVWREGHLHSIWTEKKA